MNIVNLMIGFHVSISGSIVNSVQNAENLGCTAFQIFSRNPRGWKARPWQTEEIEAFKKKVHESYIDKNSLVVHMPYLPNLASFESDMYNKSIMTLTEEIVRCSILGIPFLVVHLGSHHGKGENSGIEQIRKAFNLAIDQFNSKYKKRLPVNILLENSAGEKNDIGSKFEQIRILIDLIGDKRIGVCLDTCHAFAAGYDLRTPKKVREFIEELDRIVGLKNLKVLHLNDSKCNFNEKKDRHEHIGLGCIGDDGMREILCVKDFHKIPIIMETPIDNIRGDKDNMIVVKKMIEEAGI